MVELLRKAQQHELDHWEKYQIANGLTPRSLRSLMRMDEIDGFTGGYDPEKRKEMKEKMGSAYLHRDHPHREHHRQWKKQYRKKYGHFESDNPETHPWIVDAGETPKAETPQPEQQKQKKPNQQSRRRTDPSTYKIIPPTKVEKTGFEGSRSFEDPNRHQQVLNHAKKSGIQFAANDAISTFIRRLVITTGRHGRNWHTTGHKDDIHDTHPTYSAVHSALDHPAFYQRHHAAVGSPTSRNLEYIRPKTEPTLEGETQDQANSRADARDSKEHLHSVLNGINDTIFNIQHENDRWLRWHQDSSNTVKEVDLGARHLVGSDHFNSMLRKIMQHPHIDANHLQKISKMMMVIGNSNRDWRNVAKGLRGRDTSPEDSKPNDSSWMAHREFMRDLMDHPADTDASVAHHIHSVSQMSGHENAIDPHILEMARNRIQHGSSFGPETTSENLINMVSDVLTENLYFRSI